MVGHLQILPNRRQFLAIGMGVPWSKSSGTTLREARSAILGGKLGEVRFCRISSGSAGRLARHLEAVEFLLDCGTALSISSQRNGSKLFMATVRYPRCIVSYESRAGIEDAITFHGDRATLRVSR
jgi:hypothetical protein